MPSKRRLYCILHISAASVLTCMPAALAAQEIVSDPPRAEVIGRDDTSAADIGSTDACPGADVCHDLAVRMMESTIYNPATGRFDKVKLRQYEDQLVVPDGVSDQIIAPTVELNPGDTFRLVLRNELLPVEQMAYPFEDPNDPDRLLKCEDDAVDHNEPHCSHFNLTNNHFHGFWGSPEGNSDNVLITINPSVPFTYEYNIAEDHPAGTFWYHSHRHGSTAPQVSSGMAGAILVRGNRQPHLLGEAVTAGDLDVVLPRPDDQLVDEEGELTPAAYEPHPGGPRIRERLMLFQQVAYACRWTQDEIDGVQVGNDPFSQLDAKAKGLLYPGKIKTAWRPDPNNPGALVEAEWFCDEDDWGMVEPGIRDPFDQLAFGSWNSSERHTSINGAVGKRIATVNPVTGQVDNPVAGQVERWRLIHAGVREPIRLRIIKAAEPEDAAAVVDQLRRVPGRTDAADFLDQTCGRLEGDPLEVLSAATDGLTRKTLDPRLETWLQPGYREDLLVSFDEPGLWCVLNGDIPAQDGINRQPAAPQLLGYLIVDEGPVTITGSRDRIIATLARSMEAQIENADFRERAVEELTGGRMGLSFFQDQLDIAADEVDSYQTLGFNFAPPKFAIGEIGLRLANTGVAVTGTDPAAKLPDVLNEVAAHSGDLSLQLMPLGDAEYEANRVDRLLQLDNTDEWWLTSFPRASHPFHIHVNPFQIVGIYQVPLDSQNPPANRSFKAGDPADWLNVAARLTPADNNQWAGLVGTWKDTLFIPPDHIAIVRTRYRRYVGDFVLHCHILDHEDQGMMQNVRIALPDGKGGFEIPFAEGHDGH